MTDTKTENKQRSDAPQSESVFARIRRQVLEREQAEAARQELLRQFKIEGKR
jgi:hypothetical protein